MHLDGYPMVYLGSIQFFRYFVFIHLEKRFLEKEF